MDSGDQSSEFAGVVDSVMNLFGEVMSRDAICAIVEHCAGDLTQAIDIIVNMADDKAEIEVANHTTSNDEINQRTNNAAATSIPVAQNPTNIPEASPTTYAGMSRSQGSFLKMVPAKQVPTNTQINIWTLQTQQIVGYHNQGSRVLILMRGLPGSGKSFLAKELVRVMCPGTNITHIFTTDDFFMHRGQYNYNKCMLSEAHYWNQNRVREAIGRGVSPIFVDNTNVEIWHMEPYVKAGVSNGYIIEVLEPNTPWAKKAGQLARKNSHDVPVNTIRRLLDHYQNAVSGAYLIRTFGLSYPADKKPPVKRSLPPFAESDSLQEDHHYHHTSQPLIQDEESQVLSPQIRSKVSTVIQNDTSVLQPNEQEIASTSQTQSASSQIPATLSQANANLIKNLATPTQTNMTLPECSSIEPYIETIVQNQQETLGINDAETIVQNQQETLNTNDATTTVPSTDVEILPNDDENDVSLTQFKELRMELDKIEKFDVDWENGVAWNDDSDATTNAVTENASAFTPKPPRKADVNTLESDKFLPSASNYSDWTKISMFLPAWNEDQPTNLLNSSDIKPETRSISTSVEFGDTDNNKKNLKVLVCEPRNINYEYSGLNKKKNHNQGRLDKSSMTNYHDHVAIKTLRCKNEEKHFAAFRKLFKDISKVELRDIFDKCVGDVNWAVDIVLDGMTTNQLHTIGSGSISDTDDFDDEECECLAAYNIIPSVNTQPRVTIENVDATLSEAAAGPSTPKCKKEKIVSESSIQLKRQIEQNVVIPDSHYSDHCLKIRKIRRGEFDNGKGDSIQEETEDNSSAAPPNITEPIAESNFSTDDDDSQTTCSEDLERIVNVDLGRVFVSELDSMFGRSDMIYPGNIVTRVNMPVSLLNEINALWIESFMYQLDQESRQSEMMLRQDEEFARQLELKEEQLAKAGREPAVPDLKDIMDMELALSIYKKEITAEWRNNEPNDLAARMTREKLYNLFPDVQPEILSELLMAHDNNFQATVEVLLSSTGNGQILEEENGVAKFITKKELERHEKLIQEQKALSEVEWPLLPKDVKVDMKTVQEYRAKASQHLAQRNLYYQRAQSFFNRDMTQIATYYSDVAGLHKKKFDHANSLAAATLMQIHAANCTDNATIDLHFLHVPEARESLDLFLDTHIQKLREMLAREGSSRRFHTLFFITGRGLHSPGGPRIKPAVKRRLRERGIAFTERNPGLLSSKVCADDKLTYEVP